MELKLVNRVYRQISEQQRSKLSKAWFAVNLTHAARDVNAKKQGEYLLQLRSAKRLIVRRSMGFLNEDSMHRERTKSITAIMELLP
jgi:hypothetical protein